MIILKTYSSFTEKHYIYLLFRMSHSLKKNPFGYSTVKMWENIFLFVFRICSCLQAWFHSPMAFSSSNKTLNFMIGAITNLPDVPPPLPIIALFQGLGQWEGTMT